MPLRKTSRTFWQDFRHARIFASRSRALSEQESWFEALAEKYRRLLVGFLFRMVHDQTVAEELALESFLHLYRSPNGFEEEKAAIQLYRVAVRLAIKHGENSTRATRSSVAGAAANVGEPRETEQERISAVRRQVEELPERQRVALLLHKYQGLDYQQIAEVMEITEPTTKALLFEAYETLRIKLDRYMGTV